MSVSQNTDLQPMSLDEHFWNTQWENKTTGWDIGYAAPAIVNYMQQYADKKACILIPGCGNAYEAEALIGLGFEHIVIVDIAEKAVANLKEKFKNYPTIKIIKGDFFELEGTFDLMIEQTFFCALPPSERTNYVTQAAKLLQPEGKIIGVLFDTHFEKIGPPFGGTKAEYELLFQKHFDIQKMERCDCSIKPRAGNEVFIILKKKENE